MVQVTPKQCGKNVRMNFGKINEVLEMPNLIEVQKNSYKWFREKGLKEVFRDVSSITDYNGNLVLNFTDYRIDDTPKYTIAECKERDVTYAAPLRVTATLWNKETGEVKESEIFMGDFPLMTESGTFVINGAERVIVSQLVRSPGVYYASEKDRTGKDLFKATVIPNRGAWLEYEMDSNDVVYVRIDKNRKIPITTFIRSLGIGSDEEIAEMFGSDERLTQTILQKDTTKNTEDALIDVYKKLRPGEPPTVESSLTHLNNLFFDAKRYDLCRFGRYKYNKKLMKKVKEYLESDGHSVDLYICPEKVFTTASQEKSWKLTRLNAKNYDLVVEGHLNCYNGKAHGTEVLYVSENGKRYAKRVQKKLVSAGFTDRDVQKRTNLYMLNGTKATTIMTESFFCDSKSDYKIGKNVNKIAKLIAEGICNKKLGTATKVKEAVKTTVSKVVNKTAYAKVVTKSDPLMIRQSANVSSKIIGKIPKKSKVEVLKKGSTWTKVKYKSVTGYSATRYLKF